MFCSLKMKPKTFLNNFFIIMCVTISFITCRPCPSTTMKITIQLILLVLSPFEITTELNSFRHILQTKSNTYVDKTLLLKDVLQPVFQGKTLLITMPKRFGKSTNLHMIKSFCEIEMLNDATPVTKNPNNVDDTPNYHMFTQNYTTFGQLKITKEKEFVQENLGKHPVAYFDFWPCSNEVKNLNDGVYCCGMVIQSTFHLHEYLLNSTILDDDKKDIIRKWTSDETQTYKERKDVVLGIRNLMEILFTHFGKTVIVLVDEFDAFFNSVMRGNLSDEETKSILKFYATIFLGSLKYENHLRVAVLTGIVHISDYGLSDGLPRFRKFLFARNQDFVQHYGFSWEEVHELFERPKNNFTNLNFRKMKEYYDGYNMYGKNVYAPYSIIRCLETKTIEPFWANVGSINYIWPALRIMKIRNMIIDLCSNTSLNVKIYETIDLEAILDLKSCIQKSGAVRERVMNKIEVFFSFLLDAGYFKINLDNKPYFNVSLANEETRLDLKKLLDKYVTETKSTTEKTISDEIVRLLEEIGYNNFEKNIQSITDNTDQLGKTNFPEKEDYKEADLNDLIRTVFFQTNVKYRVERKVDIIAISTPSPQLVTAAPKHANTITLGPRKQKTTKETAYKEGESGKKGKQSYVDFIVPEMDNNLVIIELKYGDYGTSRTALEQINTKYAGGVMKSKYHNKLPPYNLLMLGIHLARRETRIPYITVSAQIVRVINTSNFGEPKIIHCKPTESSNSIEDNSSPTEPIESPNFIEDISHSTKPTESSNSIEDISHSTKPSDGLNSIEDNTRPARLEKHSKPRSPMRKRRGPKDIF